MSDHTRDTRPRRVLQPIAAGLSVTAVFVAVLSIPLEAASQLGLTPGETSSWILVLYGLPSVVAVGLMIRYRQPLLMTGNVFIIIFVLLLGGELRWSELVGATFVAGVVVLGLALVGLTYRLASMLPAPIVYGILAGAVLNLLADMFTVLGHETLVVGATLVAYFVTRAWSDGRVPPLLPALLVGVVVAFLGADTGPPPTPVWPEAIVTLPELTLRAVLTATPVLVVFITLQANAPSVVFLRSQGFEPPEKSISILSGVATTLGSFFGPMGVSLSLPATALIAGPHAGDRDIRYWAGLLAAGFGLAIAALAGFAADLTGYIPAGLLSALVGLAVLGILAQALQEITRGPLLLGPLVAFAVSVSDLQLLGLGQFFWALVFGLAVSLLLEREAWKISSTSEVGVSPAR